MAHSLSERMARSARPARNRVATLARIARAHIPVYAVFASLSFNGLETLGARMTETRKGHLSLLGIGVMMLLVGPAVAQQGGTNANGASCSNGPLSFLSDLYGLVTKSAGMIILSMVIIAGVLKMIPMRGTNSWGNALVGSVIVGVIFLVVGPAVVDMADQSSDAVNMNAQC